MTTWIRRLAGFALALTIALTSVTMAMARGQTRDAAGSIIICSGAGVVQIQLDADGNPIGPAHICPDCALGALAFIDLPQSEPSAVGLEYQIGFVIEPVSLSGIAGSEPRARGPPVV